MSHFLKINYRKLRDWKLIEIFCSPMIEEVDYEAEEEIRPDANGQPKDGGQKAAKAKVKGRGHKRNPDEEERYRGRGGLFEKIEQEPGSGPAQCEYFSVKFLCFAIMSSYRIN
jgi:hypothetical protein